MNFSRRGAMKTAGLIVVAVLAMLALVLIILKFKDSGSGPGVSAVPLTSPQGQRAANNSIAPGITGAPAAAATGARKAPAAQQFDRDLEIQVIDGASKQPLEGVELSISMQGAGGSRKDRTETKGKAWLMLPAEDPKYLSIQSKLTGYVSKSTEWRGEPIPATALIEMEKGTSIGGVVKDEEGNPIKGAGVAMLFPGDRKAGGRGMYMTEGPFRTDAEGKWRCDVVPADLSNLSMKLDHPDFVSDESYGASPRPTDPELRAMSAVSVMKRGIALAGVVTDMQGKPIAGASILQGADRFGSNNPKMKTDAEGRFAFKNARPGPVVLTVTAKTFAPELRSVNVGPGAPPVEFKLGPGNTVKGKVVDKNGKPVGGAFVAADTWRGNRSLDWRVNTKGDGTFVWKEAPSDDVLIDMGKQGYQSKRKFAVKPSQTEYVITLQAPQKIHGAVVDAESGAPIPSFKVLQGLAWNNNPGQAPQVSWQRDWGSVVGKDGQFEMTFDEPYPFRCLRIEALGYLPAVSPLYKPEDTDMTFDVKLAKGTGPAGIVKNPDGTPAADVDVALATMANGVGMRNGVLDARMGGGGAMAKTKEDGKFEFPPQTEQFLLVAASPAGYGEVSQEQFTKSKELTLQPWGRVEGTLKIGSKPGANQQVVLNATRAYDQNAPRFWAQYETTTDKDGNFIFERAPVGDAQVNRQVMHRTNAQYTSSTFTHTAMVTIKAGQTAKVQLGGVGRPLVGKLNIPKEALTKNWQIQGGMSTKQPEPPTPKNFEEMTEAQQQEWWKKYAETPEYKEMQKKSRHLNFQVQPDGTFKMEDVMPGTYQLYFNAQDQSKQNWEQVAMGSGEVTVAEIPGGFTDQPQELGTFELRLIKKIEVGDPPPALTALADLDGKPIKLEDYKGKVLLLYFWSSNHPQSTAEIPKLKELYEAFGKDGRLVMVGFNFDRAAPVAKSYVTKNEIKWPQVYAAKLNLFQDLGLRNFPCYLLFGTDGKLIAREPPVDQLKAEVEKAVK